MLYSMTGFGTAKTEVKDKTIQIDIRTLNSKGFDLNLRVSNTYRCIEPEIRQLLSSQLKRGKIDVFFNVEYNEETKPVEFNFPLIENYKSELKKITPEVNDSDLLETLIRLPNVFQNNKEELDEEEKQSILNNLKESINSVNDFRLKEGNQLLEEFTLRINNITSLLEKVEAYEEERIEKVKERIESNLKEVTVEFDKNRFEQELIYYLEKFDVSEEKQRLKAHCDYFISELNSKESNGKKLGFITQEIGREINTLGSKSNHHKMQKIVVKMKDELEKIKEQVLNVL